MVLDNHSQFLATYNNGWTTISSTDVYAYSALYIAWIVGDGTSGNGFGSAWQASGTGDATITIEFHSEVSPYPSMSSIEFITNPIFADNGGIITAGRFYDSNLVQVGDTITMPYSSSGVVTNRNPGLPTVGDIPAVPAYTYCQLLS